jgi:phosphatidylserine/phosphatidylglycerophosphate/cardiolipin synthase-like enzyme
MLLGSQNFSVASVDYNRELSIITRNPAVVAAVSRALVGDDAGAVPYSPAAASSSAPAKGSGARCTATLTRTEPSHPNDMIRVYGHHDQAARNLSVRCGMPAWR